MNTTTTPALPDIVYHYCSVETFYNIVLHHTLRLSDIEKSNDFMEKKWAIQQCLHHIKNHIEQPEFTGDRELGYELLKQLGIHFKQFNTMILACCFSSERDLLSQWRGYGENGRGVCIGFDARAMFHNAFERADSYFRFSSAHHQLPIELFFHNIKYTTDEIEENILALFHSYLTTEIQSDSLSDTALDLVKMIYPALPFFKMRSFSEEREWRCVYYPNLPAPPYSFEHFTETRFRNILSGQRRERNLDAFRLLDLKYRLRADNLVPYRDLDFGSLPVPFLKSVTIGPKSPLDRETVKLFLELNNISVPFDEIYKSEASYR
ncbi:MAG: DUF2971 domain-containing protein [Butyricicoccaceae bacterium]